MDRLDKLSNAMAAMIGILIGIAFITLVAGPMNSLMLLPFAGVTIVGMIATYWQERKAKKNVDGGR